MSPFSTGVETTMMPEVHAVHASSLAATFCAVDVYSHIMKQANLDALHVARNSFTNAATLTLVCPCP